VKALQAGDLASAKAAFEAALAKNEKDAEALFYLGVVLDKGGDRAGAEKKYVEALGVKPDLEEATANLAALYVESEKFDEAVKLLRPAVAKHPKDAALRTNLALALAGKGDKDGARKAFEDAEKLAPNDAMLLLSHGHWLLGLKETDAAIAKLRAAKDVAGADVGVLAAVGHELRLAGAFSDCTQVFDKAIAAKDAAELRVERALCKMGAKDDAGALADLQAAVAKEPGYAPAHFYLAGRLAAQGKWDEVVKEYEAYLKLEPKGPMARTAEERIKLAKEKAKGGGKKK
jgi:Flp pilus assembly protein TadD